MKKILYFSFYFEPDLSAGSFRNSTLAVKLANLAKEKNCIIEVYTTFPNRYETFSEVTVKFEKRDNLLIHRIKLPLHSSGIIDQARSFLTYYYQVHKLVKNKDFDIIFASSSRLFTAYLAYRIAKKRKKKLYLDIRDILVDTINDIIKFKFLKIFLIPIFKLLERKTFNYANHINLISGGFREYFYKFKCKSYTEFSNGIDDEFILANTNFDNINSFRIIKTILYAGNIGEGQGLHKIIPQAAKMLGKEYKFIIIGDGGAKFKLINELIINKVDNVEIKSPVRRSDLISEYRNATFLFIHLNNFDAFLKVLPSKIFELSTFNKPIIAGVDGYAKNFLSNEISNCLIFRPCDVNSMVRLIKEYKIPLNIDRRLFIEKFRRDNINHLLSESILKLL